MDRLALAALLAVLATGLALLALRILRDSRARAARRATFLNACRAIFDAPRLSTGATGFPRLAGRYRGQMFDIQVVPDTLTFRKLPALWVLVSRPAPMPLGATLDVMIRPTGVEPFSNFHTLPTQIDAPAGFPEDCAVRTDDPAGLPPEHLLFPHLGLFEDTHVKELVVSPKGLRISFLAEEANRGRYLIFRDAEMGLTRLPPEILRPKLDALLRIEADLRAPAESLSA